MCKTSPCERHGDYGWRGPWSGCSCCGGMGCHCCVGSSSMRRRYPTSQERMERLEEYREELKKELQGVEEEIEKIG